MVSVASVTGFSEVPVKNLIEVYVMNRDYSLEGLSNPYQPRQDDLERSREIVEVMAEEIGRGSGSSMGELEAELLE